MHNRLAICMLLKNVYSTTRHGGFPGSKFNMYTRISHKLYSTAKHEIYKSKFLLNFISLATKIIYLQLQNQLCRMEILTFLTCEYLLSNYEYKCNCMNRLLLICFHSNNNYIKKIPKARAQSQLYLGDAVRED